MKTFFSTLLLVFFIITISASNLKISEIMSNNVSAVMDESYNYSMWVELYNSGLETENLNSYYFTDDLEQPRKWNPKNEQLAAGQFKILWFEREELSDHSSFKLEPNGGRLYLLDNQANIIDQVRYYKQYRNVSYGRTDDVGDEWAYFTEFSPAASNIGKKAAEEPACQQPQFSQSGGFYNAPVQLTLSSPDTEVEIYYTTDNSEPTAQSNHYTAGQNISLNKTTCIRAIALSDTYLPSPVVTSTYFINERSFTLPVVSLVTEEKNLKDDMIGIYVKGKNGLAGNGTDAANWNQDWDRPTNMELYDTTGVMCINQEIDISISGGWSRAYSQKSLKLSPRNKFGDNRLRYDFFASKPDRKYKDIQLRNSGNDFWSTMMRDALMQSLIIGRMDIDYQAYEPAICFMNGEYYGIQNLRERTNKDYLYSNYGLNEDEFILLDYQTAPNDPEYRSFLNFMKSSNLAMESLYKTAEGWIDIDSYTYYMMAQMYYANTDWPQNNYKVWMKNDGAGKWRWILFDTDFGFSNNQNQNAVTYVLQSSDDKITTPLRRLLTNPNFKSKFLTRYAIHLSSTFESNRVIAFIDSLSAKIHSEMTYHKQKWGGNNFENELNIMKTFARERPGYMMEFLSAYFFQSAPIHDIYILSNNENSTYLFNDDTIKDNSIRMKYFRNQTVEIEASDVPDYRFSHWEVSSVPSDSTLIAS
ncbi:MAG: CotH kinase family protein, partial [Candidatus Symbiothrix sp.]|nr:CotH kinase family protein [Candidatus Symbiothrix sp.]